MRKTKAPVSNRFDYVPPVQAKPVDDRLFPCSTPGCPGERLFHKGQGSRVHDPKPYDDDTRCVSCRSASTIEAGLLVAIEKHRLEMVAGALSLAKIADRKYTREEMRRQGEGDTFISHQVDDFHSPEGLF